MSAILGFALAAALALTPIEVTLVDGEATGYATFQSHNQKLVSNDRGIFITHIRTRNEAYTAQTWRLSRSTDGGKTFATVYEATHATNPPVLETSTRGDIYLIRADFADGNAYLYRFPAGAAFDKPLITPIPGAAAGKYAAALDAQRGRLYFASHNDTFNVMDLEGRVTRSVKLWTGGAHAVMQYPLLDVAEDGAVYVAWTTQKNGGVYLYWDIHHMFSPDGGAAWRNFDGAALTPPVVVDDSGPTSRLTLDDEFEFHTWLSNFIVHRGKAHFMYLAQTTPQREHYIRYDLRIGAQDCRLQPRFGGEKLQIASLDGFFARGGDDLYVVGSSGGHIVCLRSADGGTTWSDYAASDQTYNVYSLGGCRTITRDGYIIGTFTDQAGSNADVHGTSKVYFVRIKSAPR